MSHLIIVIIINKYLIAFVENYWIVFCEWKNGSKFWHRGKKKCSPPRNHLKQVSNEHRTYVALYTTA